MTRQLAVYDSLDKRLYGIDPRNATGIPIPAFKVVAALPAVGTALGEAYLVTTSKTAFVWDGAAWEPIVPSVLVTYPDDATLLADNAQTAGTYAASIATGNLFIRSAAGWHQVGVRTYATAAALLADTTVPDGSIAVALDEVTFWLHSNGAWICQSARPFATVAAMRGWTPQDGQEAVVTPTGLFYTRVGGAWLPKSVFMDTEANIRASTTQLSGQIAATTDSGRLLVWDGTDWVGSPFREYATEVLLKAATPADGTMAVAVDTGAVAYRAAGAWVGINAAPEFIAPNRTSDPATGVEGQIYLDTSTHNLRIYTHGGWRTLPRNLQELNNVDFSGVPVDWQTIRYNAATGKFVPAILPHRLTDLTDVDLATQAPVDGDTLVFDIASHTFKPTKGGSGIVGTAEPAVADRTYNMAWWDGSRLWIWTLPGVWVEA